MNFTTEHNESMFKGGHGKKLDVIYQAHARIRESDVFRDRIEQACKDDPLLFLNLFGHADDPRVSPTNVPLTLFPYQEELAVKILRGIGSHDVVISHSPDLGVSWITSGLALWMWLFRPGTSSLFVARTQSALERGAFRRLGYMFKRLPGWLKARSNSPHPVFRQNMENGSVIEGEAESADGFCGTRHTAVFIDDVDSLRDPRIVLMCARDVTRSRIVSGRGGGSSAGVRREMVSSSGDTIRLPWYVHPRKSAGLYRTDETGKLHVIDILGHPEGYRPILDGKLRSPWYDKECRSYVSPEEIQQELDQQYEPPSDDA